MTTAAEKEHLQSHGLYAADQEHDACGVGFVAHIKGQKSHAIVGQALKILENLDHRGAVGADKLMGDGAGILIQLPDALYREEMAKQGVNLPPMGEYGVGMIFLPKEHASRLACEQEVERAIRAEGQRQFGIRNPALHRTAGHSDQTNLASAEAEYRQAAQQADAEQPNARLGVVRARAHRQRRRDRPQRFARGVIRFALRRLDAVLISTRAQSL